MAQLLSNLPVGALVKDLGTKYYNAVIVWKIADKNHTGYPANSVTLVSNKILALKCFDASEPSNPNASRKKEGNNRYSYSNIRQWLNSSARGGAWYSVKHSYDTPPSDYYVYSGWNDYDWEAGFLNGFSESLRAELLETTLIVANNKVTDGGGSEKTRDKVFLASVTEVGLANENGISEGSKFALFSNDASRQAFLTNDCINQTERLPSDYKSGDYWGWLLRTPQVKRSQYTVPVHKSGAAGMASSSMGIDGVRPFLNLPSEILVSDSPGSDGAYTILWQVPPIIRVKQSGVWKNTAPWVKHNGVWKKATAVYAKQNGVWKKTV